MVELYALADVSGNILAAAQVAAPQSQREGDSNLPQAAAFAIGVGTLGPGAGLGYAVARAMDAVGRNP